MAAYFNQAAGVNVQGPQSDSASLLDFSHLSVETKKHLQRVYNYLALATAAAAFGSYVALSLHLDTFLASLGAIICILAIAFTRQQGETLQRQLFLAGLGFCTGISAAPLLELAIYIDPGLILQTFAATSASFVCFSFAALRSTNRSYLYLGGILASMLTGLLVMSLINMFLQSSTLFSIELYGGLLVFCGFVCYDTQLIVAKQQMGDNDAIWHSVDLFIDFVALFKRILIILAKNKSEESDNKNRRRR